MRFYYAHPDLYAAITRKECKAKAQLIVKSTKEVGEIAIEVTSPGLVKGEIKLKSLRK